MKKKSTALKLVKQEEKQLTKASEKLQSAIQDCSDAFLKLEDSIQKAKEIGEDEGFTSMEIGDMIRVRLIAAGWSKSTIQRRLPENMKHAEKIRSQTPKSAVIMTANPTETETEEPETETSESMPRPQSVQQQQETSEPEETDSQKKARKYQEPQEQTQEENTDISVTQEQAVREYGLILEPDGLIQGLDFDNIPSRKDLTRFSHSYLVDLASCALEGLEQSMASNQNLEEENSKLETRIAQLESSSSEVKTTLEPTSKSKKEKTALASYGEHKQFAVSKKIKSRPQWRKYMKDNKDQIPPNITSRPDVAFVGKGWDGWKAFFA